MNPSTGSKELRKEDMEKSTIWTSRFIQEECITDNKRC